MSEQQGIAIVGVSALFPGSSDAGGFWRDILAGSDLLTEVPPTHWLLDDYHDADNAEDKTYATRGAFLSDVDFAPMEFGVPPNILSATDSSQLLALIVARQLLEDAAQGPFEALDRERVGVVLGVASTTELCLHMAGRLQQPVFERAMRQTGLEPEQVEAVSERVSEMYVPWEENTFPGLLGNVVAGRIANRFDLGGTNAVVDAACASSLAAVEIGINKLELGQADMMITGGVDALNDILMYMCFSKTGALSPTGDCRPFSIDGDGTMMAEGLGMFALKRLEDAEAAGDQIYAVIRGVGSSSDGRAKSIYAPRPEGQSKALRRAYEAAGYGPNTVELVEAHGTATNAGDAAEVRGLKAVFADESNGEAGAKRWCALGSVKSQIGHAKAAAGAAGLFKTVMALNHRVLPPTIKVDEPNPALELNDSPFHLNTQRRPWVRGSEHPRRASVSAFGFGGTNFHVTLEEYNGPGKRAERSRTCESELVLLSAASPKALVERCRELAAEADTDGLLSFLARRSQEAFEASEPARLAVVAQDEDSLQQKLTQAADAIDSDPEASFSAPNGIHYGHKLEPGEVAILFPGQGSQYVGMGAELAMQFEQAGGVWDRAADLVFDGEEDRLHEVVFPPPAFSDEERDAQTKRLTATQWAQPAIGAASLSMLRVLEDLGVQPACVGGHSYGEVTALCAAGVLGEREMLEVSRKRGDLMANASTEPGSMTAVSATIDELEPRLASWDVDVVVANHNSPRQVVLSGATAQIDQVEELLADEDISFKRLPVSTAFHSSLVSDSSEPFLDFLEDIDFGEATCPVYANSEAAPYPAAPEAMRRQLAEQIAKPVRFVEQVEHMYDQGARTFLEVGPRSILTRLVGKCLDGRDHHRVHVDRRGKDGAESLWNALGQLSVLGVELDFAPLWSGFRDIIDPREQEEPPFVVALNGANYDKPYPPDNHKEVFAEAREKADQKREERRKELAAQATPNDATDSPSTRYETPVEAPETMTKKPEQATYRPPTDERTNGRASAPAHQHSEPMGSDERSAWIRAYQEQQRQTAEAHQTFQQMMAESHRAFLETMDNSFDSLSHMAAGEAPPARPKRSQTQRSHTQPQQTFAPQHQQPAQPAATPRKGNGRAESWPGSEHTMHQVHQQPAQPAHQPTHQPARHDRLVADGPAPSASAPAAPAKPTPTQQKSAPDPAAAPEPAAKPAVDMSELLLEVVADKTGYPREMLQPDMELESDLGVDSIKRVEILAEMEDRVPELPEVDTTEMAELRRLDEIIDYMQASMDAAGAGSAAPAAPAAEAGSSAPSPAADIDLSELLLEVVADKTGYPREMLQPDMELESDLGVDSIKRVEILAEMEDRVPELPEVDTTEMAELRRLDEIIDYMQASMGARQPRSQSAGGDAQSSTEESEDDSEADPGSSTAGLARYAVRAVSAPASGASMPGLSGLEQIYVAGETDGLGPVLVEALGERGLNAELCEAVPEGAEAAIFLGGLASVGGPDEALAVNRRAFQAAKALVSGDDPSPRLFVTVQDTGGDFGLSGSAGDRAWLAGTAALAKTAAVEWPDTAVKAIDLSRNGRNLQVQADAIADELFGGGPEVEVGLGAERITLVGMPEDIEPTDQSPTVDEDSIIIVSGGARGVTATATIALAERTAANFVLLGRTELVDEPAVCRGVEGDAALKRTLLEDAKERGEAITPRDLQSQVRHVLACREIRDTLARLEAAGSKASYVSVDVRDEDALGEAFDEVREQWGPITGIVHGAGVLADAFIAKKTLEQFERVVGTKTEGLRALLAATEDDPIELICTFSSVAARSGNPGQSDYAMANEILNKVAAAERLRRGDGCRVSSIGWGPWDGGMVTPALKRHFEEQGVVLIPQAAGGQMFADEILEAPASDVEVVLGGSVSAEGINGTSLEDGVSVQMHIDATTHPYLDSHRLKGVPVVPAMVVLDWFLRLARGCRPDLHVHACRDMEVRNGVQLHGFDEGGDLLTLTARQVTDDEAVGTRLAVELRGADDKLHYVAVVEMGDQPVEPSGDLAESFVLDPETSDIPLDGAYEAGRLFHGPDFEVLTDIVGIDDTGGVAALDGVRRMGWPDEGWLTDPAALDGALQIGLLWGLQTMGKQTLPMRMERFVPFVSSAANEPLECVVRKRKNSSKRIVADVLLRTAGGQVLAEMLGVAMYAVPDEV